MSSIWFRTPCFYIFSQLGLSNLYKFSLKYFSRISLKMLEAELQYHYKKISYLPLPGSQRLYPPILLLLSMASCSS